MQNPFLPQELGVVLLPLNSTRKRSNTSQMPSNATQESLSKNVTLFWASIGASRKCDLTRLCFRFFGNRSLCYERMQQYENACRDADVALSIKPKWIKGLFRKGKALCGLKVKHSLCVYISIWAIWVCTFQYWLVKASFSSLEHCRDILLHFSRDITRPRWSIGRWLNWTVRGSKPKKSWNKPRLCTSWWDITHKSAQIKYSICLCWPWF